MSLQMVRYYYEQGVFDKAKMCQLVYNNIITAKEFFEITRLTFWVIYQEVKENMRNIDSLLDKKHAGAALSRFDQN